MTTAEDAASSEKDSHVHPDQELSSSTDTTPLPPASANDISLLKCQRVSGFEEPFIEIQQPVVDRHPTPDRFSSPTPPESQSSFHIEDENNDDDDDKVSDDLDDIDTISPSVSKTPPPAFSMAQWVAETTDQDAMTKTPSRSRKGGRIFNRYSAADLGELQILERDGPLLVQRRRSFHILRSEGQGGRGDDDDNNDDDENGDNDTMILRTPSKRGRRKMQAIDRVDTLTSPGAWLDRWKNGINMTHSTMKPPKSLEAKEDEEEGDEGNEVSDPVSLTDGGPAGLGFATPKRRKKTLMSQDLELESLHTEHAVSNSKKRLAADDDDDNDDDYDDDDDGNIENHDEDTAEFEDDHENNSVDDDDDEDVDGVEDGSDQEQDNVKNMPRLSWTDLNRIPLTPIRRPLSMSQFQTPPKKRILVDPSTVRPPRLGLLSPGKVPMFLPIGVVSPSQRQQKHDEGWSSRLLQEPKTPLKRS
ncbi:hypothetical protein BGZ98_007193 [Dissophora globulifera]|nr:hypothetical protein BGZ98_007193 [Dissophora globulifera]